MSSLMIREPPLVVLPSLAQLVGLNGALVLQQVHYWLGKNPHCFEGKAWVRNTHEQWHAQFPFWSLRTLQRVLATLEEEEFLLTFSTSDFRHTKYYTLNYTKLEDLVSRPSPTRQHDGLELAKMAETSRHSDVTNCPSPGSYPSLNTSKTLEIQGLRSFCQYDISESVKMAERERHNGGLEVATLTSSYKLNTENTYTENPPPLTPPPTLSSAQKQEDKEEGLKSEKLKKIPTEQPTLSKPNPDGFFQKLVDLWNAEVQNHLYEGSKALLTPERTKKFCSFLAETSVCDVNAWKAYCQKIRQNRFLMGENQTGFKVTLDWALKPAHALKVLEGAFYVKPKEEVSNLESQLKTRGEKLTSEYAVLLKQHCTSHGYSDRWFEVCKTLVNELGRDIFENWFKDMVPTEQKEGFLLLTVKNAFFADHIRTYYDAPLRKAIRQAFTPSTIFRIRVGPVSTSLSG